MNVILADKQDISRVGLIHLLSEHGDTTYKYAEDKAELIMQLKAQPDSVVVIDYTLFDLNDADEMLIMGLRFPESHWLMFSEELSADFLRKVLSSGQQFSILLKDAHLSEIDEALTYVLAHRRFICQHVAELLLTSEPVNEERVNLTKTETEILIDIAMGLTTREIADKRVSSFHTVNTHRKNIFRKLGVNNAREATKYALRAGLVDAAEYYI